MALAVGWLPILIYYLNLFRAFECNVNPISVDFVEQSVEHCPISPKIFFAPKPLTDKQ
jgi:hypothetical protein